MRRILRHILPLSLRVRFLLATAAVVLVLSLSYGMVALVGYSVSFDKTTFRLLRGESNLFYTLADMSHIKYSSYVKEKSIADPAYAEPPSRFVYAGNRVFEFKNTSNHNVQNSTIASLTTREQK